MASNIVLTGLEGATSLTLFGNDSAAEGAGEFVVWDKFSIVKPSPWSEVEYAGFDGIDAKFFGAKPAEYTVFGHVGRAGASPPGNPATEANLTTGRNSVLTLNDTQERFSVTGPFTNATGQGMIVKDITFLEIGSGTGAKHRFQFIIRDLLTP